MSAKKSAPSKTAPKKGKAPPAHPPWVDMIKECIADHPEDARSGVSRPQIKKYVEHKYQLDLGAAQNTHLARAIATGTENNIFVLPKVEFPVLLSMHMEKLMLINYQQAPLQTGRVKLAPKTQPAESSVGVKKAKPTTTAKKPTTKAAATKPAAKVSATKKAASGGTASRPPATKASTTAKKPVVKTSKPSTAAPSSKKATGKAVTTTKKPQPASKKVAGKPAANTTKKSTTAKKTAAATKAAAKPPAKAAAKKTATRKKPTKRS